MMRTDMRIIKTKEALHNALLELLNEKTLEVISISEICRKAKINRGTFYLHYKQVEDLFEEYFKEITADLTRSYQEPYRYVSVLKTSKLNPSTIRIFHHIEKYKTFYRIVFSKKVPLMYYYLFFEEIKHLLFQDKGSLLKEGVNDSLYCSYQANAIIGIIIEWYQNDFSYSTSYLNDQLVQILNMKVDG
ncbi:TetR/AcrR family transcriptional regulator [Bacillus nitratireducens]|uniref:TetR/AcrR family transcriptional regulator n=1 Tax=Bacillus nitratireducens TaxID=2026193 RepID=UPI000B42E4E7|nr:TetR/AcrR family transcriptional regulator [Bacillus nitratireducens]PDY23432.1 TetR/AcrR family transcriptional regulator [Bacillus cereus]MED0989914.1 TetR/AcrR family transcriptional regulator [Bacillus nitratireducens]PEA27532.1 TetR/AcrR family transcriptional regulator [Bacillus cereus]PEQ41174.1 TetR/AcrR family transcriptional regulator [Bacillus cereus]PER21625.1 TetR/AcrR family transcriptional regulator [Bacillus cereus]